MSWSLAIVNGDLSYGQHGLNTVVGADKVVQDLECCILEPLGTDYSDPDFGSIIEGGIDSDGNIYMSLIGDTNDDTTAALIEVELQRIAQNYQAEQVERNQNDLSTYGVSTLSAGEALLSISNITTQQVGTMCYVTATLTTGTGTVNISQGFGS